MTQLNDIVSITLLDRKYHVKCPSEKTSDLLEAASYLDNKIREANEGGKTSNLDRTFMIAALNIAHELIHLNQQKKAYIESMSQRIQDLQNKIEQTLAEK